MIVYLGFLVVALLVIAQIVRLQFFTDYASRSEEIAYRTVPVKANRGSILARDGRVMASTVPFYEIRMDCVAPADSNVRKHLSGLCQALSTFFGNKTAAQYEREIRDARAKGSRYKLISNRDISYSELCQLKTFPLFNLGPFQGGIIPVTKERRVRPYDRLALRTVGYISEEDRRGVGIEYAYDAQLRGKEGSQIMRRGAANKWIPVDNEPLYAPENGLDVQSTIDIEIQEVAENALRKQLARSDVFEGATAVVMEVETGAVRAIVNMKRKKDGTFDETFNYAISESTNPGSTFKLATLICLLEDGYVHLTDTVTSESPGWRYGGHTFSESSGHGYGKISIQQALEKSSNQAFAKLAVQYYGNQEKHFINRLYNMKLNERLNIDLIGEGRAYIPFPDDASWSKLSLPMIAIGYEMQLTPLHTLTLYNAVANNGRIVTPYFVESLNKYGKPIEVFTHTPLSNAICTPATLAAVHQALRGVVERGTVKSINDPRYAISGKTGTSQIAFQNANGKSVMKDHMGRHKHQASFVGFFPSEAPKYSMIVVLYTGLISANFYGGTWAAPVFKEIADHIYITHPYWNAPVTPQTTSYATLSTH